jgi:hypothetical protein
MFIFQLPSFAMIVSGVGRVSNRGESETGGALRYIRAHLGEKIAKLVPGFVFVASCAIKTGGPKAV